MYVVFRSSDDMVSVSKKQDIRYETSLLNTSHRMTATPDTPVGRDVLYELRETNLMSSGDVNGNGNTPRLMIDKAVQFEADMDLNNVSDYNGTADINSYTPPSREVETTLTAVWSPSSHNETIPVHAKVESTDGTIKAWRREIEDVSSSSEQQQKPLQQQPTTDDGPRYKINEGNPTTPDGTQSQTNTSTWRIRDRDRHSSGSEDEIEKISESILEVRSGGDAKPGRTDEGKVGEPDTGRPHQVKRNESGADEDEDGDCVIQCLAYTLQCCECVIS